MQNIKVDEALWASGMLREGIVERWFIASGARIKAGERIAEIRIEDALHEIVAPGNGRATNVVTANAVIEPGSVLATLTTRCDPAYGAQRLMVWDSVFSDPRGRKTTRDNRKTQEIARC